MKKHLLLLLAAFSMMTVGLNAQRYLTPQFSDVSKTTTIYGKNYTVLAVPQIGRTLGQPLVADVYTPNGDTETKRPLAIFFHSGNFLPSPQNGSYSGLRIDSTAIEVCTRLAKMGYVTASADYRLGWNPLASTQESRINGLINAAYRGLQDANTCIRYFKEKADLFGVDTNKIMLIGAGTGGYITLATASMDSYLKVISTTSPANKFIGSNGLPMVIQQLPPALGGTVVNGDREAKLLGTVPPGGPGVPPTGDTLCFPNWVNHTSKFHFCVNMGGAMGDISWMDQNTPPIVSFQVPYDQNAPYKSNILYVPVPPSPLPVVEVQGSYEVQKKAKELGTNKSFSDCKFKKQYDPYGEAAAAKNSGYEGLFPVYGTVDNTGKPNVNDADPWAFWDIKKYDTIPHPNPAAGGLSIHKVSLLSVPDAGPAKARRYLDSIVGYFTPRAYVSMKLGSTEVCQAPSVKVTFSVDMKNETIDPAKGVCIAGNFQKDAGFASDWTPGITKLVNKSGTTIWEYTADLPIGKIYEYKFINDDGWNGKEEKMNGKGCYSGDNRSFTVGSSDMTVGTFCYNKCFACDVFAVRLSVELPSKVTASPNGVHVAGAFQGWDPSKTPMKQVGTSKKYEVTVGMKAGEQEYKFVNGNAWGSDEIIAAGAPCNKAGSTNRVITVSGDVTAPDVCFGVCVSCAVATNDVAFDNSLEIYPNPTSGQVTLAFNFDQTMNKLNVKIMNALGQTVTNRDLQGVLSGNTSFDLSSMSAGIYMIHITDGEKFSTKRIVLEK